MNSCVDLLSPPAWWCGLKFRESQLAREAVQVTTCVVVWIEILVNEQIKDYAMSPPAWWCGLKFQQPKWAAVLR